eukprot:Hpha_TRINITY_DN10477_c0_g1::TRINITY_DN10477_c0_g1_i1::g.193267::m.193267
MKRVLNWCSECLVRDSDNADELRIKRTLTPVIVLITIVEVIVLLRYLMEGNRTMTIGTIFVVAACFGFLIGGRFSPMGIVLDYSIVLFAIGILIDDSHVAAEATARGWSVVVLLLDVALVFDRYHTTPVVIGLTLAYLTFERCEAVYRFGMYDVARKGTVEKCECDSPPCEVPLFSSATQLAYFAGVLLIDFYLTRGFASALRKQLHLIEASVTVSQTITEYLARYEVELAQKEVEGPAGDNLPAELRESFRSLLANLFVYRPYLPAALFAVDEEDAGSRSSSDELASSASADAPLNHLRGSRGSMSNQTSKVDKMSELRLGIRRCTLLRAACKMDDSGSVDGQSITDVVSGFVTTVLDGAKVHKGVLLTLGADHVLVGWNTHAPLPTHAHNGVICSLFVHPRVLQLPVTHPGVAVCSGGMFVGTAGSKDTHIAPVVVGSLYSLSVALTSLPAQLGVGCVCDEGTYEHTRSEIVARVVDVVRVQGHDSFVYEVAGTSSQAEMDVQVQGVYKDDEALARYTGAFSALRQLRWTRARDLLNEQLNKFPMDTQALRLLKLSMLFENAPPLDDRGDPLNRYVRLFTGWPGYEASTDKLDMPHNIRAWQEGQARPEDTIRCATVSTDLQSIVSDDSGSHMSAIRQAIEDNRRRTSDNSGDLPRDLVDQQGRKYFRANRVLGKGAFGEVFIGMAGNGGLVALKAMILPDTLRRGKRSSFEGLATVDMPVGCLFPFRSADTESDTVTRGDVIHDLLKEVALMCQLRHENIVSYLGTAVCREHLVVVLEYVPGGSLHSLVWQFDGQIPLSSVKRYLGDTLNGLDYLHTRGVVHRDLKPHNVLIAADGTGKLADFGASEELQKLAGGEQNVTGTPQYMSPEQCRGEAQAASDVWSLGIMAAELLTSRLPWPSGTPTGFAFIQDMGSDDSTLHPDFGGVQKYGGLAAEFCCDCCNRYPMERPTVKELSSYAFMIS